MTHSQTAIRFPVQGVSAMAPCIVCGRSILMGECSVGHFTEDGNGPYDVCVLCTPDAPAFGLTAQEPKRITSPSQAPKIRRFNPISWLVNRLASPHHQSLEMAPTGMSAIVPALAGFQQTEHMGVINGLTKTLGKPVINVRPLSESSSVIILTCIWEIRWYQFEICGDRVDIRLGNDAVHDLAVDYTVHNCLIEDSGTFSLIPAHTTR